MRISTLAVFTGLTFVSFAPVAAQDALRAPLSIVPSPMQAAIDQVAVKNAVRGGSGEDARAKLAPRAAARQMKRAVRAVAAKPGADTDVVQIGQLGALEDAPVGLEMGFGDAVWTGARLAFVVDQLARLPDRIAMPGLYHLERHLHRGATAAPIGTVDKTSWFAARLMRLLHLGDTQSVIDLEAETGAARNDGYVARVLALAHLGRGDRAAACEVPRPARGMKGRRDTLEFFMQMLVYCQLFEGAYEKAGLTLELNAKTLGKDELFREMAYLMSAQVALTFGTKQDVAAAKKAGTEAPIVLPDELTPMQIALLQLAGEPLPPGLINLPNYFMQAVAGDFAQPPGLQLSAAHLAVRYGASPEVFSQAAQLADLSGLVGPLPPVEVEAPAVFLAQALRLIDASDAPAQPHMVARFLRQALARDLWHDAVAILDDRLDALLVPQVEALLVPVDFDGMSADLDSVLPDLNGTAEVVPDIATDVAEPLPLNDADRLILLLAHWQAGHQAAAQNLMFLHPLGADLARLARWQGFDPDATPDEVRAVAEADAFFGPDIEALGDPNFTYEYGRDVAAMTPDTLPALAATPSDAATDALDNTVSAPPFVPSVSVPVLDAGLQPDWVLFEARLSSATPAEAVYLRRQLGVYHALGAALPETLMIDLVLPEEDPVAQRLARLADNKWIGDLILAQVSVLADKPAASYDAADTALLLGMLNRAGLFDAARDLAADMLLSATLQLAVAAPHLLIEGAAVDMPLVPSPIFEPISEPIFEPISEPASLPAGANGG